MAIIYEPNPGIIDLRLAVGQGLFEAAILGVGDFIRGENKDWAYYAGAAVGYTAAATSIPGASATLFVAATAFEMSYEVGPEGAQFAVFVDGVQFATVSSFAEINAWDKLVLSFANELMKRVEIVHQGVPAESSASFGWLAFGALTIDGQAPYIRDNTPQGEPKMANIISFSIQDTDGDTNSVPLYVDEELTLAQYTGFGQAAAPIIQTVTGGKVTGITLQLNIALPGAMSNDPVRPAGGYENQRGALFSFTTTSRYKHSVRIPAAFDDVFAGKDVNQAAPGVPALINMLTGGLDVDGFQVIPRDRYGNDLVALATATKSHRRK